MINKHNLKVLILTGADFVKWLVYSCFIGVLVGAAAVAFHYGIDVATEIRYHHPGIVWTMPLGGMVIILLYMLCGMEKDRGTNQVLVAAREAEPMKLRTAPLIFLSTVITHLVGGSAGREGAALQLGGSMAAWVGKKIRLDDKNRRVMVMCGMAAAFSALFGTPLTASVFAIEVVSVGTMQYSALVPCLMASMLALRLSMWFGLHMGDGYIVTQIPTVTFDMMLRVALFGALCALLSILFCEAMHTAPKVYAKCISDPVIRAAVGGALVALLTVVVGNENYNGAGDPVIRRLLAGETIPSAFLMKIIFTALTLGAGFRGGEIVPVLFTGCAFGTWVGPMLGIPHSFAGALGMAAVFCGATNCPMASMLLAYELFGGESLPLYALCCGVSYTLSGYYGLYSAQQILFSKSRPERVDKTAE